MGGGKVGNPPRSAKTKASERLRLEKEAKEEAERKRREELEKSGRKERKGRKGKGAGESSASANGGDEEVDSATLAKISKAVSSNKKGSTSAPPLILKISRNGNKEGKRKDPPEPLEYFEDEDAEEPLVRRSSKKGTTQPVDNALGSSVGKLLMDGQDCFGGNRRMWRSPGYDIDASNPNW